MNSDEKLTAEELAEIEKRLAKISPGPWRSFVEGRDHTSGSSFIMTGESHSRGPDIELSGATAEDQDFIAACREDVPRLLGHIRVLEAARKEGKSEES